MTEFLDVNFEITLLKFCPCFCSRNGFREPREDGPIEDRGNNSSTESAKFRQDNAKCTPGMGDTCIHGGSEQHGF